MALDISKISLDLMYDLSNVADSIKLMRRQHEKITRNIK